MADKDKTTNEGQDPVASGGGRRMKSMATLGLFGGVMLIEGLAIFFAMKFLGSEPDPTLAVEGMKPTTRPVQERKELEVCHMRVPNSNGSQTTLYNIRIAVVVHYTSEEEVRGMLENRQHAIEDRIGQVVRSADQRHLAEPGLESLKRQIQFELNNMLGDDQLIEAVLIPELMPLPTGF